MKVYLILFALIFALTSSLVQNREVRVVNSTAAPGQTVNISIELASQGNENAIGFSINFNPAILSNAAVTLGSGASAATLNINSLQASNGRLGIALMLPTQQSFNAGVNQVVNITFNVAANAPAGSTAISFGDQPVTREVVAANAAVLATTFTQGTIMISPSTDPAPVRSVSAASFLGDEIAIESIIAAFGLNLATAVDTAASIPLPTSLAGTTVVIKDSAGIERLAPLFFVAPRQVNYQIPPGTAVGRATVTVTSGDSKVSVGTPQIANVTPGLFTANSSGDGVAAATIIRVKQNGDQLHESISRFDPSLDRYVSIPIDLSSEVDQIFLVLYGTGVRFRSSLSGVGAKIGGSDVIVEFAGPVMGFVGLDQINLRLERALSGRGEVDLVLTVDGKIGNIVKVNIK